MTLTEPVGLIRWSFPRELRELFDVFDQLDSGSTMALAPPDAKGSAPIADVIGAPAEQASWLGICSSGSTGRPKLVWWRWVELHAELKRSVSLHGWNWASPFTPSTFAGVQVALQAWGTGGNIFSLSSAAATSWPVLLQNRCVALSCTPTFIDLLLQQESNASKRWQPQQITLGGEVLAPALGERLRARFPATRFSVIYAASEFGVLLKSHRLDGWYELNTLTKRFPDWRVKAGVLEIKRPIGWASTGDRVEVKRGLIRVVGRADAVANVAGTKVSLVEISALAEQVPGVRRAVALAEASPICGQIVCLRFSVDPVFELAQVTEALQTHLRKSLRKEAWPRRWEVDEVGPVVNAKRQSR